MTTAATPKPAKYDYQGEFIDADPVAWAKLETEYKLAALQLQEAKDRAFAVEQNIKDLMQGYEHLRVNGETRVSWTWQTKNVFDKAALLKEHPDLHDKYTTLIPNGKRVFDAKPIGVTHVE